MHKPEDFLRLLKSASFSDLSSSVIRFAYRVIQLETLTDGYFCSKKFCCRNPQVKWIRFKPSLDICITVTFFVLSYE